MAHDPAYGELLRLARERIEEVRDHSDVLGVIWPEIAEDKSEIARHHRDFEEIRRELTRIESLRDNAPVEWGTNVPAIVDDAIKRLRNIVG